MIDFLKIKELFAALENLGFKTKKDLQKKQKQLVKIENNDYYRKAKY